MARIPLRSLFDYLRATVTTVAHDAACEAPVVAVEGAEVAVAPPIYRALTEAVPHLVRNAVIHGLEAGEERVESGKPAVGTITIRAARQGAALTVAVADDGRGLQLERLRERAGQLGLPTPSSPEASADLVFTPGLTTVGQASVDRGRGVGAKAAKDAIETVGGRIGVRRNEGAGTVFEITIEDFSVQERPVARTEGDDTCSS
jgi:two-component system chemotaxis sensor kinase CheA